MSLLTPTQSSNLAADIYLVQDKHTEGVFFELHEDVVQAGSSNVMKAEVAQG